MSGRYILKYSMLVIVASLIHNSVMFFLVFLLVPFLKRSRLLNWLYPIMILISIMIKYLFQSGKLIANIVYLLTKSTRTDLWFSFSTGLGFIACIGLHGLMLLIIYRQNVRIKKIMSHGIIYNNWIVVSSSYAMLQIMSLSFPFYLFSVEFIRLFRGLFIYFFAITMEQSKFLDCYNGKKRKTARRRNVWYLLVFSALFVYSFTPFNVVFSYYNTII